MSAIKIHSPSVILVEGNANEFIPNHAPEAGMHGLAIMVPPGEGGERLLDMLWRIAMAYALMPSLLRSRAKVHKMVEAVMGGESWEPRSGRKGRQADRAHHGRLAPAKKLIGPGPAAKASLLKAVDRVERPRSVPKEKGRAPAGKKDEHGR